MSHPNPLAPCAVPDCSKARAVTRTGKPYSYCQEHLNAIAKKHRDKHKKSRRTPTKPSANQQLHMQGGRSSTKRPLIIHLGRPIPGTHLTHRYEDTNEVAPIYTGSLTLPQARCEQAFEDAERSHYDSVVVDGVLYLNRWRGAWYATCQIEEKKQR